MLSLARSSNTVGGGGGYMCVRHRVGVLRSAIWTFLTYLTRRREVTTNLHPALLILASDPADRSHLHRGRLALSWQAGPARGVGTRVGAPL